MTLQEAAGTWALVYERAAVETKELRLGRVGGKSAVTAKLRDGTGEM
jgi:hypothetical protein